MAVHVIPSSDARDGGVGLQFWGLSGSDRQAWEDFVRALVTMRREAARKAAGRAASVSPGPHPASLEMNTPSGIRTVGAMGTVAPSSAPEPERFTERSTPRRTHRDRQG
jgi:hypothetical protein